MFNILNLFIMKLIAKEITTADEWYEYCEKELWGGAENRWKDMNEKEREYLCDYMNDVFTEEIGLTATEINDFVWFNSDDILEDWRQQMNDVFGDAYED